MKIQRRIERTMELTAHEVYAAIAAKYDLVTNPTEAHFRLSKDTICSHITLQAIELSEQDVPDDR